MSNLHLIPSEIFTDFVKSYLATAEWADKPEESKATVWTKQAIIDAENECEVFLNLCAENLGIEKTIEVFSYAGNDVTSLAGHDYYLTKNGHGAGFWDKDEWNDILENGCDILSDLARKTSGVNVGVHYGKLIFQ